MTIGHSLLSPRENEADGSMEATRDGRRKNAKRVPKGTWKRLRGEIYKLYILEKKTLRQVQDILLQNHGFHATKRQWVHQLWKWRMKKYKGNAERPPHQPESSPASSVSTDCNPQDRPTPARASASPIPPPAGSPTGSAGARMLEDDAEGRYDYEDVTTGRDSSLAPTFTPKRTKPAGFGRSLRMEAAHVLFANCDDRAALPLFVAELDAGEDMGISCARSVYPGVDPVLCERIDRRLEEDRRRDPGLDILCDLLQVYVARQSGKDQNQISACITRLVEKITGNRALTSDIHRGHGTDLITYHFLSYALVFYNEHQREDATGINTQQILEGFISLSPTRELAGPGSSIRGCLSWCIDTLKEGAPMSEQLHIPYSSPEFRKWSEYLKVSFYLWGHWQAKLHIPPAYPWDRAAERELAIPPTELLVYVCWLAMHKAPYSPPPPRTRPRRPSPQQQQPSKDDLDLLGRALAGFETLQSLNDDDLWRKFLARFSRMGKMFELTSGEREFKATALRHVRSYVSTVLDIVPNLDPVRACSAADESQRIG